jgi:DNA-binding transcriptional LysR family regulator
VLPREKLLEQLLSEMIPLGVTSRKFEHHELISESLFEDKVILIVYSSHPWAMKGKATLADIVNQPIIMREESSGTRETMLEGLKAHGITLDRLNVVMELGSAEAIELAVERGMGIAFVSEMIATRGLSLGLVKKVDLDGLELHRNVFITKRVNYPSTRAQNKFWTFAIEQRQKLNTEIWNSLTTLGSV